MRLSPIPIRRRQYSAAGCSSVCSLPSRGVGSQSRSRCGSPERMSKTSAHPPKQVQSLRNRRCGRSVLRRPAHDRSVRKQNNPTTKAVPRRPSPTGTTRPGIAKRNINALCLPSHVWLVHTAGMQITALFSPSFSKAALQSKASCSTGKGPASNPSIKRTVKGLRPLPAAYVKRWASQGTDQ